MKYPFNHSEDLRQSVRHARVVTHCPRCQEMVGSMGFTTLAPTDMNCWLDYSNAGVNHCYCPSCNLFLEGWYRQKNEDEPELSLVCWQQDPVGGRWETQDLLFGEALAETTADKRNELINDDFRSYGKLMKWARHDRELSGPRFVEDDDKCTIGIPLAERTEDEAATLLAAVQMKLKNGRAGKLTGSEISEGVLWGHFDQSHGIDLAAVMWRNGLLPSDVTFWRFNCGRSYQTVLWDFSASAPLVHSSVSGMPMPVETRKRTPFLGSTASLTEAASWLNSRLCELQDEQPELDDTLNREELFSYLKSFVSNEPEPECGFSLDDANAERRLLRVLKTFSRVACPLAERQGLTSGQRMQLLSDGGDFLADLMDCGHQ